jgi:O-methyltransferase
VSYLKYYARLAKESTYSVAKGIALPIFRNEAVRSGAHAMAYPISSYSPWQTDKRFLEAHARVRKNTFVDVWRCYELWRLVDELQDIPGDIIEVGVWRGGSGALMATQAQALGLDATVYLCDTWEGVVKTTSVDTYYHDGKHDNTSQQIVAGLVADMALRNVELLQGIFPDDTADRVDGNTFRLVHIDVDVYQSAKDVLEWAWPRLSSGGVVVFDDYGFPACPGVAKLFDEQRAHNDRLLIHNLNGHGLIVKR